MEWLTAALALMGAVGCTGDTEDGPGDPPPLGYPFIPSGYSVTITRVSDDCAVGGLTGTPQASSLRWRQDIVSLSGALGGVGQSSALDVQARLCAQTPVNPAAPVDPAAFALHWTASGRGQVLLDTDRRCRVDAVTPPGSSAEEPPCGAGNRWFLSECGAFVGEASVALSFSEGCEVPRNCLLQLRYVGLPSVDHPDATLAQRLRCSSKELADLGLTASELDTASGALEAGRISAEAARTAAGAVTDATAQ